MDVGGTVQQREDSKEQAFTGARNENCVGRGEDKAIKGCRDHKCR